MITELDYFHKHKQYPSDHFKARARLREWEHWMGGVAGALEPSNRTKNLDEQLIDRMTKEAIFELARGLMDFDTKTLQRSPEPVQILLQEHKPSNRIAALLYRAACENFSGSGNLHGSSSAIKKTSPILCAIYNDLILTRQIMPHPGNQFALKLQAMRRLGHVNQTKSFRAKPRQNSDDNAPMGGMSR